MNKKLEKEVNKYIKKYKLNCTIEEFPNKVNWDLLPSECDISQSFILYYSFHLDFYTILLTRDFSKSFLKKMFRSMGYEQFSDLILRISIDTDRVNEFKKYIDFINFPNKSQLLHYFNFTEKELIKYFDLNKLDKMDWFEISSRSKKLSINFIEKYKDFLDWDCVVCKKQFSEKNMEKFLKYYDFVSSPPSFQRYSEEFIEKHHKDFNFETLIRYNYKTKLSDKFILKYKLLGYIK